MIAQPLRMIGATFAGFVIALLAVMSLMVGRPAAAQQANAGAPTPVPPGASVTIVNPLAYRTPQGNIAVTSMAALAQSGAGKAPYDPGVAITQDAGKGHTYDNLRWSPDGTNLLFTDSNSNSAYLAVSGQKPVQIASNLAPNFPAAWAPDGKQIAVAVGTGQSSADGTVYQIQLLTLSSGTVSQPQFGASFVVGANCGGGGTNDPALALYSIETAPAGYTFSLDWTPTGFLHSIDCSGRGVGFTSLGEQNTDWTAPSISRVVPSPDGAKAAGVVVAQGGDLYLQSGTLAEIDLRNGAISEVTGDTTVDRVAWSPDGKNLVYTTRAVGTSFPLTAKAPAEAQAMFNDLRGYACGVWHIALGDANAKPVELFHSDERGTYALGLLQVSGDQSAIAVTSILSDAALVNALNQGASLKAAAGDAPYASILLLPWSGASQSVSTALLGGQPAIGKGPFTAIAAQNQQPSAGSSPTLAPVGNPQNQSSGAQSTAIG
ncbi:MAG TPA: hypothetical protein VKQ72_12255, partial [Aggregatilineales bacterium]|nr:hypothetical protein [Aggregatilineales bacterium]